MEQEPDNLHATLTQLAVAVGRLDEQMKAMRSDLLYHTTNEHKSFEDALEVVAEIKNDVKKLQDLVSASKGAWWMLAKIGAVIVFLVALGKLILDLLSR